MVEKDFFIDGDWLSKDEQAGRCSLLQLLLTDETDGLVAEPDALTLAWNGLFRQELAAAAHQRRILPPRRHLRR
jgi:hypothetical protein